MSSREKILKTLEFRIPVDRSKFREKGLFTWKELMNTPGVETTDVVRDIFYKNVVARVKNRDPLSYNETVEENQSVPFVSVYRYVEETDEEYFKRMKERQDFEKKHEEKERLEFLRLKAKYGD